ncbi:PREDICTED: WASH complex subunit 7 homolog [Drosophila arizonae]|uniref:WASH complex subunit 7 homolog n=1 Tax=Drosophila arizonae TaxID=7263 RepID=A0ABM1PVE1_DROAR|nr:PREDICTED: WASH complex subunit 7 homolog [Drosophila arizonae]
MKLAHLKYVIGSINNKEKSNLQKITNSKMKQSSLSIFAEDILKDYGTFMEQHDSKMQLLRKQMLNNGTEEQLLTSVLPAIEIKYIENDSINGFFNLRLTEPELLANKPLTTLSNLCNQCNDLTQIAQQLQLKFLSTSNQIETLQISLGISPNMSLEHILCKMSSAIDFFCQVYFMLKRAIAVLQNIWMQITSYASIAIDIHEAHLFNIFDAMAELLQHIVTFNEITEQSNLSSKWSFYRKWLQTLAKNSETFERCSSFELNGLETSLNDIENVITGNIFRIFLHSLLETKRQLNLKDANVNYITQHSNAYIRKLMSCLEANQAHEFKHYEDPKYLLRLTAFICVLHQLGILLDGKLLKNALDTLLRYQRVSLERNVYWSPQAFIAKHAKTLLKAQDKPHDNLKQYLATVERINGNDFKTCRQLGTQLTLWSISMQRVFTTGCFDQLKSFSKLIIQGQGYANQVNNLIDGLIKRHLTLNLPVGKATLFTICKLMQYLQVLQKIFADNQTLCIRFMSSLLQWQKQKIQHLLMLTKKSIVDLKLMQKKMSILTTLKLSEKSIKGYPNKRQLNMVNLALSEYLDKDRTLPADKQKLLKSISLRTHNLCRLQRNMLGQFDATQLISNYDALALASEAGLKEYVQQQHNPYQLQNLFAASSKLDKNLGLFQLGDGSCQTTQKLLDCERDFLCNHLEYLLRVEALSHLFLSQEHPFTQTTIDYRSCIKVPATEVNGAYNILKDNLENYFTATFYNLTTIAPHDWKSYEKMRHLANKLLQLRPVDDYLPNQIIDQGIDVLQIMRNIHTFASSYAYNMNLQLFVEMQSRNKHLDIIGTRHVANSVQTHGTGIINTTVNFIYQFLRQKFYTFSTFLHDEHIKSRLLKEYRYHAEQKHKKPYQSYPYERAESFIKKIRKLGVSSNGETYMDLFRKVITQVGNAVGYVRLLQSGSKNANFRSRSFMSRFHSNFMRGEAKDLDPTTMGSIREYEKSVEHLKECYSDCTNYFKLLMQGFQPFLCNPHNHHLRTFFLIAPALIMNYIDYRVKEKLKMYKKDQSKCSLFEDGFAIGLVYILNMLNQLGDFHELGWQLTTTHQLNAERMKLKNTLATQAKNPSNSTHPTATDEKLLQTVAITERHVNAFEQEYNLLYATLSSAEIFFQ